MIKVNCPKHGKQWARFSTDNIMIVECGCKVINNSSKDDDVREACNESCDKCGGCGETCNDCVVL